MLPVAQLRHCEERSDEAIQRASWLSQAALDCFAPLAMTSSPVLAARFLFEREFPVPPCCYGFPACAISWVFLCPPRPQTKGKRNAERRVVTTRALRARGALLRSALASRRRHRGSCQGDSWSPRLCTRPCFGRQSGAFDPVRPPQPGGGDLALLHGCYPRRTNPRTVSTSRTGHDAGRLMPDAARERVTSPPAGTALAPSQGVSSRRTSLRKARWGLLVRRAVWIQEIPAAGAICLI